jgi:hypothetical protein
MINWTINNFSTIVITGIFIILFSLVIRYLYKSRKKGQCIGCSCSKKDCIHCNLPKEEKQNELFKNIFIN